MNTLVSFVTLGHRGNIETGGAGMTAALIARRIFMPGPSSGNRAGIAPLDQQEPKPGEVATSTAVVTKVSLVCNVQRFGLDVGVRMHQIQHHGEAERSYECADENRQSHAANGSHADQWHQA